MNVFEYNVTTPCQGLGYGLEKERFLLVFFNFQDKVKNLQIRQYLSLSIK